tara:strand:- start:200 stop:496 length:297 start_codon:yes stop_codon:yes gene_type:complete
MEMIPVLTKNQLINANNWAIEIGYNRAVEPKPLQEYLDSVEEDTKFPITSTLLHEHAAGKKIEEHIRCKVILNAHGDTALIDMDLEFFNGLDRIEFSE